MTTASTRTRRVPARVLKSPLAGVAPAAQAGASAASPTLGAAGARAQLSDRESTLAEFEDYLRTVNNRDGRPYETPG